MRDDSSFLKIASQWLAAVLLAGTLSAFFLFASAYQVTSDGTAHRILTRGVAITTDIDALLPRLETELHSVAESSDADPVRVPGFPLPVDIPRAEARTISGSDLRTRILDQSADRLYEDGMSAWAQADTEGRQDIERISTAGGLHRGFALATQKWNTVFLVAAVLFGFLSLVLAVLLWVALKSYMRLLVLGAAISTAAVLSLAAAVATRFALRTAETEADPFEVELIGLGVDTVWLFIRNYLVISLLGFVILSVSSLLLWWQSRTTPRAAVRTIDTTA
jgi:hypothetical protein